MEHRAMSRDSPLQQILALRKHAPPHEAKHLHGNLVTLLTKKRSNKLSPVVRSVLQRNPARVLDVGCGYGALAVFFALQGIEAVGIDLKEDQLQAGRELARELDLFNAAFHAMDACAISLSGFAMALSTDFYEHLPPEKQPFHLRSVFQALQPGGAYLIRAPHRANIRQHRGEHIGLPSFGSLRRQADEAGFRIRFGIAHTACLSPVTYHAALERWFESRKWSERAIYKGLQKCGLANVLACLEKPLLVRV
jgi:SAM-dependent methyltransferase